MSHPDNPGPFRAGCGFFSARDLQEAIEGRLTPQRTQEFESHVAQGCAECVTLAADLATYRRLLAGGPLDSERREQELHSEPLRELLRREIRRRKLTST